MQPTNHDVPAMDQIHMRSPMSSGNKYYFTTATATATANNGDNNNDDDPTTPKFTVDP